MRLPTLLRQIRAQSGKPLMELLSGIGARPETWWRWEAGSSLPSERHIGAILRLITAYKGKEEADKAFEEWAIAMKLLKERLRAARRAARARRGHVVRKNL